MKIALICFSLTGQETGEKLCCGLEKAGVTAVLAKKSKYLPDSIKVSTSAWAGKKFLDSDALIFIGATGSQSAVLHRMWRRRNQILRYW